MYTYGLTEIQALAGPLGIWDVSNGIGCGGYITIGSEVNNKNQIESKPIKILN